MFGINYSDFEDGVAQLKACFSFCLFGLIANAFAAIFLFKQARGESTGDMPMGLSKQIVSTGLGGVALFCYFIGGCCGLTAFPTMFKNNAAIKDELMYHTGGAFQIIAIIVAAAVVPLTFVATTDDETAEGPEQPTKAPMFSDVALAAPGVEKTTETVDIELGEVEAAPGVEKTTETVDIYRTRRG